MDATDEDTILGYGVQCTRMDKRSRVTNRKKMCLQQLHVSFDIMSYDAYHRCNIRNNIWKDFSADNFLPLYINAEHGSRAMRLNKTHLPSLVNDGSEFTPETIIQTYGKAMNTIVVDMMLSVKDVSTGQLKLMDSIKALEGYMALHHTLLAYALEYPQLVDQCEERVGKFIHDVQARDKEVVPDIGELLIAMSLTDYSWSEFVLAWLEESMTRGVRWTLAKFPNLLQKEKKFSCVRLNQTYTATKTGKRLAMFQRFFIERIACPPELEGNPEKNKILFRQYNERCGRPPVGLAEELQQHSRKVLACEDWYSFFNLVGFVAPSAMKVWKWLLNAIEISEHKKYHQVHKILRYTEHHLESPSDTRHCQKINCMCSGRIEAMTKKLPQSKSGTTQGKEVSTAAVSKSSQSERLDVAFCVDTTGSMGRWIKAAKEQVRRTMSKLKESGKQVRFGFVAYKDHFNEGEVTKVSDFTQDEQECQGIVDGWYTKSNTDTAEALATALGEVGGLTWDPRAQRICIVITDAPPHGLGRNVGYGDIYPEGPPDGSDVFKNAHTLGLAGVALYMVYTGRNGLCESVYRGLARRTGGAFLRLTNSSADQLSQIVLTSSLEEDLLDNLAKTVTKHYDQIKARHKIARREQIEYQLHAACVAANVTTSSYWEDEDFDAYHEKQIDDFVECMDLAHARSMVKSGYYGNFPRTNNSELVKREAVVSKAQIKKILQRVEYQRKMEDIKANQCRFRRSEWSTRVAASRWDEFAAKQSFDVQNVMKSFEPWAKLTRTKLSYYAKIPSTTSIKMKPIPLTDEYTRKKKEMYLRVEAEEGVLVRSDPIDTSAVVGLLAKTTVIKVLQQKGTWPMWIQHTDGWSEWRKGVFSRHSPEYTGVHNKINEQHRQGEEARLQALPWKQNDRIKCNRWVIVRGVSIMKGHEFIVHSVNRDKRGKYVFIIKKVGSKNQMIKVPNEPETIQEFEKMSVLPEPTPKVEVISTDVVVDKKMETPTSVTENQFSVGDEIQVVETFMSNDDQKRVLHVGLFLQVNRVDEQSNLLAKITHDNQCVWIKERNFDRIQKISYQVGDRLECVPYKRLQEGTATWRVCIVTQLQPFTCVFEHNGNEIKRSVYKYLTFLPAPPAVSNLTDSAPHITPATALASCSASDASSSVTGASSDTGSSNISLSLDYRRNTYVGDQTSHMKACTAGSQYFVTNQRLVVRRDLDPASAIVHELPVDTIITMSCTCRERGYVVAPVSGWCWLSSPKCPLIRAMTIPSVVAPTIVYKQSGASNMETFERVVRLLRFYGIQITQTTVVDNETVEIEVGSHSDGVTAIKSIRRMNDEFVSFAWKPSYLKYRNLSSQVMTQV